jgi:hypothetical protein
MARQNSQRLSPADNDEIWSRLDRIHKRVARFERAVRREPDEALVHLSEVYLSGVAEDAMGVTNRRFTRREFLLYEAVMDGQPRGR